MKIKLYSFPFNHKARKLAVSCNMAKTITVSLKSLHCIGTLSLWGGGFCLTAGVKNLAILQLTVSFCP